jgi:2-oxoglutarate ferredoxin oxidoreductase subunit gamma
MTPWKRCNPRNLSQAHLSQTAIVFAGFGGQGALFAGQLLCYAGMYGGWEVSWIPSYGPEMRGGTANCTVVISDEPIGSPLVRNPDIAVVLNAPSMDKYEPLVKPNGLLVVNSTLVHRSTIRGDIRVLPVPANDLAVELGNVKMANVVLLGATLRVCPLVSLESVEKVLEDQLKGSKRAFVEPNKRALRAGATYLEQIVRPDEPLVCCGVPVSL